MKMWRSHADPETAIAAARREADSQRADAERLAAVLQSVDSAVLALDGEGRRLFANAAAEHLFALAATPEGRLPGLQRLPQLLQWVESVSASGKPWAGRLELSDQRTLQVDLTPLGIAGCVIVARDITETVHLETARRDFIAAISHELRTPLTSIQGYAEMLLDTPELDAATRAQYLQVVARNTARMSRLARDLVTLSSIETGTYPFHFQPLEAASLAPHALEEVAPLAREAGCRLVAGPMAPGRIRADADALHRVLLNLLENAIVHAPGTEPHAEPRAEVEVELSGGIETSTYVFRIRDTGVGIGSTDQPRIFERFYRVDHNRAADSGIRAHGTGLGLALVKHIVMEHGGQVELQSALGQGSTFLVHLPLWRKEASGEPQ